MAIDTFEIINAYNSGAKLSEIKQRFGISIGTIYNLLHAASQSGIRVRWRNAPYKRPLLTVDEKEVVQLYNRGVKVEDIAKQCNIGPRRLYEILSKAERAGIFVRWRSTKKMFA